MLKENCGLILRVANLREQSLDGSISIDGLIDQGNAFVPFKICPHDTVSSINFESLQKWNEIAQNDPSLGYVIYGGEHQQPMHVGNLAGWEHIGELVLKLEKGRY